MTCSPAGEASTIKSFHKQMSNCHLMSAGGGVGTGALTASMGAGNGQGKEDMRDVPQGERIVSAKASSFKGAQ